METDPIGYGDGLNWYNYVGSDPVNRRDPRGLDACYDLGLVTTRAGYQTTNDAGDIVNVGPNCGGSINAYLGGGGGGGGLGGFGGGSGGGGGGGGPRPYNSPPATPYQFPKITLCNPSPSDLANSGPVSYQGSEVGGAFGGIASNTDGTFRTANGYSGTFNTTALGAGFMIGPSIGYIWGSSESLSTFKGGNYNLIGQLGPRVISDNFTTDFRHIGETNGWAGPAGVGIGGTYSNTTITSLHCPSGG